MVSLACRRDLSSQAIAKATWRSRDAHIQSTAMRQPRSWAFGAHGAPRLTFGFALKPSPSAPWAWGLLSAFWERGSLDLPDCGLRRGGASRPYGPSSSTKHPRPSRGGRRKVSSGTTSLGRLARRRRDQGRGTSRGARGASHDDPSHGVSRNQPKVSISVQ